MKKSLLFFLLFSFSVLQAQNPGWINRNTENTGLANHVFHPLAMEVSENSRMDKKIEPVTNFQIRINSLPALKKALNHGEIIYLPDTVIERSEVPTFDSTRYRFSYNSKGLFLRGKIEKSGMSSNGKWVNNELDSCTYDTKGNRLSAVIQVWANGKWTNSTLDSFTYDASGRVLTESEVTWLNGKWTNPWRNTYTYDATGNKVAALYERYLNEKWTNSTRFNWTYDGQGNNLTYLFEKWLNEKWTNSSRFTKTYDGKGDNLTTLNENWSKEKWVNTSLDSCSFDANGNRLSEQIYGWAADRWKDSLLENLSYNLNGKMLADTVFTYENGLKKVSMGNNFKYDANGNCVATLTQGLFHDNLDWSQLFWCTLTDTCIYDANGRLLDDLRCQLGADGVSYPKRRYTYTYDTLGNMLTVSYKGIGLEWHMYDKYIFINAGNYTFLIYDFPYQVDSVNIQFSYTNVNITDVPTKPNGNLAGNALIQNYPNPFTSTTTIKYKVSESGFVSLNVFDAMGTEVASLVNEQMPVGEYSVEWNAAGFGSGMYFCRLQTGKFKNAKKLVLKK